MAEEESAEDDGSDCFTAERSRSRFLIRLCMWNHSEPWWLSYRLAAAAAQARPRRSRHRHAAQGGSTRVRRLRAPRAAPYTAPVTLPLALGAGVLDWFAVGLLVAIPSVARLPQRLAPTAREAEGGSGLLIVSDPLAFRPRASARRGRAQSHPRLSGTLIRRERTSMLELDHAAISRLR